MENKRLYNELNKFGKYVVQQSRSNLTKEKHNATKELYNSIGYFLDQTARGYKLSFEMEDYGMFQDRGVRGVKSYYADRATASSPFKYKQSSNLIGLEYHTGVFSKFAKRMGLQPRNKKGQFGSYKTMGYILANSIKDKGIKASMFFTKPFEQAFKRLPEDIEKSLIADLTENIYQK
tara:strand:+ start:54 stop:584 length:531 start_codon:yes stop_codon:yes gene_type:complete